MRNYSGRGWKGENYDSDLKTKEIAKIIKKKFNKKGFKWSVTSDYNSIDVILLKAPFDVLVDEVDYNNVNPFYIEDDEKLTDKGKELVQEVVDFANSYNYDDSDPQIDYFDTKFYLDFNVGTYKRPFKVSNGNKKKKSKKVKSKKKVSNDAFDAIPI